jgi:hypothetical protein
LLVALGGESLWYNGSRREQMAVWLILYFFIPTIQGWGRDGHFEKFPKFPLKKEKIFCGLHKACWVN